ncbi:MAG: hypothetical protein VKS61_07290 [Candidatus Sericytochromatia bacterium]|nr:hypothetical protein [Candidatus Sericytochromatia bacterium]
MVVGQIWINDVAWSCHRFEGPAETPAVVEARLKRLVVDEDLRRLGAVRLEVRPSSALRRLRLALWQRRGQ